jgi:hypothetical protein
MDQAYRLVFPRSADLWLLEPPGDRTRRMRFVIPRVDIEISPNLPERATYHLPDADEIDEEGIGFFRDTWRIAEVSQEAATYIVTEEKLVIEILDRHTHSAVAWEAVALAIEYGDPDALPVELSQVARQELDPFLPDDDVPFLEGLELGVAGLTYSLSAAGCMPAASCRSHTGAHSWAPSPTVLFAADRDRARWLQPLAYTAGCGFDIDPARPELLCIVAPSVTETTALADLILQNMPNASTPTAS